LEQLNNQLKKASKKQKSGLKKEIFRLEKEQKSA
jgi:hypothetical protein